MCRKPPSSVSWLKRFQIYSTIIHLNSVCGRAAWLIKSMYKTLYKCAVKLPFVAQTSPCKLCYVQLPSDTNLAMFPARLGLRSSLGESARLTDFFDSQMPVFHQCWPKSCICHLNSSIQSYSTFWLTVYYTLYCLSYRIYSKKSKKPNPSLGLLYIYYILCLCLHFKWDLIKRLLFCTSPIHYIGYISLELSLNTPF